MPQAANIVLADALGTPVNHTFVPIGPDQNGVFWFEDQSQANALGYWRISVEIKRPSNSPSPGTSSDGRTHRVRLGLHEPILANITNSTVTGVEPAPTLAYTSRSFTEYVMPERGVLQDRKDLRKMTEKLSADALIVSVVENLQYIY